MANKADHDLAGSLLGALASAVTSQARTPGELLVDVLLGAAGGLVGSRIPDTLEPATSPGHRSLVHGVAANGLGAYYGAGPLLRWRLQTTAVTAPRDGARVASALAMGLAAGHASHLLLDAGTPRGLPWLG